MDETSATVALSNAETCAATCSPAIDYASITACYKGAKGEALLEEQSAIWNKAYPCPAGIPAVAPSTPPSRCAVSAGAVSAAGVQRL